MKSQPKRPTKDRRPRDRTTQSATHNRQGTHADISTGHRRLRATYLVPQLSQFLASPWALCDWWQKSHMSVMPGELKQAWFLQTTLPHQPQVSETVRDGYGGSCNSGQQTERVADETGKLGQSISSLAKCACNQHIRHHCRGAPTSALSLLH